MVYGLTANARHKEVITVKVVRHEKRRGKYVGMKSGVDRDYSFTLKTGVLPPPCYTGSDNPIHCLCPHHGTGFSSSDHDPAPFAPDIFNELLKSGLLNDNEQGPACGSDTTIVVIGNVLIINRNAACPRT